MRADKRSMKRRQPLGARGEEKRRETGCTLNERKAVGLKPPGPADSIKAFDKRGVCSLAAALPD